MAQETKEIDVRAVIVLLLKKWYWILLSCTICGVIGVLYYFSTTEKYKVDASIMLRSQDDTMLQQDILRMMGVNGNRDSEDEVQVLSSFDIMDRVVDDLNLQTEYRKKDGMRWRGQYPQHDLTLIFLDSVPRGSTFVEIIVRKNGYVVKVEDVFGKEKYKIKDITKPFSTYIGAMRVVINQPMEVEEGDHYKIKTTPHFLLVDSYQKLITIALNKKGSNVINFSTETDMPRRSKDMISKMIELYNLDAIADKNAIATNAAAFIDERLNLIERELASIENEMERYKEKHDIVNLEVEVEVYLNENTEYKQKASEIVTKLNLVRYIEEFVNDEKNKDSLIPDLSIGDNANSNTLAELIRQYNELLLERMRVQRTATSNNPIIDQTNSQLAMLHASIVSSIESTRRSLEIAKQDLDDHFKEFSTQRYGLPSQERQYIELERKRRLIEKVYLYLSEKREANALTLASAVDPAKIISTPKANPGPVSPKRSMIALVCLIFGLGISVGAIYLYHLFNEKLFSDPKEFERQVKIPFGGVLVRNHHGNHIAIKEGENSVSAELFRSLRTNIRFMLPPDTKTPTILVTSSINGEGKSYVAGNLAISFALLQKRVALVGLDIRKPMLADYFGLDERGCLTAYLSDAAYSVDDVVVHSNVQGLDIIPAGIVPPNPNELLQGNRLDLLFEELRKRYDYIIVDSAPVAMVSDTFQLARVCDMTIYVCRANYTTFDLIDFLNQSEEQKRLPNMIAVLNGANAKDVGYGYGYGYGQQQNTKKGLFQRLLKK